MQDIHGIQKFKPGCCCCSEVANLLLVNVDVMQRIPSCECRLQLVASYDQLFSFLCNVHLGIIAIVQGLVALWQGELATLKSRELVPDCRVPDGNRRNVGGGHLPRALAVAPRTGPRSIMGGDVVKQPARERDV